MALTETQIQGFIDDIAAQLAEMESNPKPSYKIGHRSFNWNEYNALLLKKLEVWTKQKGMLPCTVVSRVKQKTAGT